MRPYRFNVDRKKYFIFTTVCILLITFMYVFTYLLAWDNGNHYDCVIKRMTKLYCPGCGMTRAVYCLFHGRILESLLYNPTAIYGMIVSLFYYIKLTLHVVRKKDEQFQINDIVVLSVLILVIIFCVVRNVLLVTGVWDYLGELSQYYFN